MKIITPDNSVRIRIEKLLICQSALRKHARENANHLFEIERAIETLGAGYPTDQCLCVERWVAAYLAGDVTA